jgi:hypothetical protein
VEVPLLVQITEEQQAEKEGSERGCEVKIEVFVAPFLYRLLRSSKL